MKMIVIIGLVVVLVAVLGGFWLYRATMPEDIVVEEELAPDANDVSKNSQFLQLQPKSLPPALNVKERKAEQDNEQPTEAAEEKEQVQSSAAGVGKELPVGQVSGAEDNGIEDGGGTSITDIDDPGVVISMTDLGFFPASISVAVGTAVTFVNDGQSLHWPASDNHPTHELLSEFNANQGISTGGAYAYSFSEAGEWSFHDHLNPEFAGIIIVE